MKKLHLILTTLVILFAFGKLYSQNTYEFLRLDVSPRVASLGGSFVAGTDDPNVIFYNPAGINFLENIPVSFSYLDHLMDIKMASFSISKEYQDLGHFGFGVDYINYGDFARTDADGNKFGEFGAGDVAFLLSYGNQFDENFYYGANIKYIYSKIDNASSSALGFDLGLQYYFPDQNFNIGLSFLNLGTQMDAYYGTKEELPLDVKFGFSKRFSHLPLTLFFNFTKLNQDVDKIADRFKNFSFGGEFHLSKVIHLRLGYENEKRQELVVGTTAGLSGIDLGVGLNIRNYIFDYSYSSLGLIGGMNRIGITTSF